MTGGTFQGWLGVGSAPGYTGHTGLATTAATAAAAAVSAPASTGAGTGAIYNTGPPATQAPGSDTIIPNTLLTGR